MTTKEHFIELLQSEIPIFDRVLDALAAVPEDKLSYRPDPKSRTAFELASQTIGMESSMFVTFLTTGVLDFSKLPDVKFKTASDIKRYFDENISKTKDTVASMTDDDWESTAEMFMGDGPSWKSTKGKMAWGFLVDLIHHRGQLSTYLRPMGGKVPSIYGPSADTQ